MSDFRKPRPDVPIVPTTAIVRKVKKAPKKPKGRKGRKPKGKPTGKFVSRQDPNFLLRKADDEARKAREDRQRRTQQEERQIQLQIEDRRDRRAEARQQQQLARARLAQDTAFQREQLRLQAEANTETQRFRAIQLTQAANQSAKREREAAQLQRDNFDIYGSLQRLYRQQERREGENLKLMRDFLRDQSRRVQLDPAIFRAGGRTEPFGDAATAEQRRLRRTRTRSKTPAREPEAKAISDAFDDVVGSSSSSSAEEVLPRSRRVPIEEATTGGRVVRTPLRFQGGATEEEIAAAGGIVGQTPRDIRLQEAREETTDLTSEQLRAATGGGSGSSETIRRGSGSGSDSAAKAIADITALQEQALRDVQEIIAQRPKPKTKPEPEPELEASGVLITPPTSDAEREREEFEAILAGSPEAGLSEGEGVVAPAARAVGRGAAAVGGGAIRGLAGLALGVGQGVVGQLPTAGETGAFIGKQGYRGIVAAGGLIQGGARGALAAATSPREPAVGEQMGGTLTYQGQP